MDRTQAGPGRIRMQIGRKLSSPTDHKVVARAKESRDLTIAGRRRKVVSINVLR